MARIYLDANSTTPLTPDVFEAMRPFFLEHFGNPSSIHQHGQHAQAAVERARDAVAALVNASPAEIILTSGGTESDNHALSGVLLPLAAAARAAGAPRPHLITSEIEHHAVLHAAEALVADGVDLTILPVTASGRIAPDTLARALTPHTRPHQTLVSLMLANNETGVLQPLTELARIAHAAGALVHTDAVQAVGKIPVDVRALGIDLLSLSAHKMHGPKGVGALFVRRGLTLRPLHLGGPHERQRRAGTENVPGIVGLGCAAQLASIWLRTPSTDRAPSQKTDAASNHSPDQAPDSGPTALAALRDRLEQALLAALPGTSINGAAEPRLPNTTSLSFASVDAEALLIALDIRGLSLSAGSACQSGATEPSHVLRAMGLPEARARSTVRLSLSRLTTAAEIDQATALIQDTVRQMGQLRRTADLSFRPRTSSVLTR